MDVKNFEDLQIMTLSFCDHVTSSVTWPFESRCAIFCGSSLASLWKCGASKIIEPRSWPLGVT